MVELNLPEPIDRAVAPLLAALPLEQAMPELVVVKGHPNAREIVPLVEEIVTQPVIAERPGLAAGLWLYVDELERSHTISQAIKNATGAFWHGIMHRREGDFGNSHYWFNNTGDHPAMKLIHDYADGHTFVDEVQAAHQAGRNPADLVDRQRREWAGLFQWCAED